MELELAELIEGLRSELSTAAAEGTDKDVRFEVEDIEIELEVFASVDTTGEGSVRFWVVNLGGGHERTSGSSARVKLSLKVEGVAGRRLKVSGARSAKSS